LSAAFIAAQARAADFVLFDQQTDPPAIVVGKDASACDRYAAEELAEHLRQISGKPVSIVDDAAAAPKGRWISIGQNPLNGSIDTTKLNSEQYVMEVAADGIRIKGGSPPLPNGVIGGRGTLYGVYDLLDHVGVRWYRPEPWGWFVPKLAELRLPIGRKTSSVPPYEMRSGLGGGFMRHRAMTPEMTPQMEQWSVRNRLNWSETGNDAKYGGRVNFQFGHCYYQIIRPEKYFAEHPEYYALMNGKRVSHAQLCLGNTDVQRIFTAAIVEKAKAAAESQDASVTSISVEPNDGAAWCECDLCRAMDDPKHPEVMSNRVATFNNMIAREVAKVAPGIRLHWLAYSAHTMPPTIVERLEPNTILQAATINEFGDYSRMLDDAESNANKTFRKVLQGWSDRRPSGIMVYEYWSGYAWPGPLPLTRIMADRIKKYPQYRVRGIYNESSPHWGSQGLELYMFAKLIWNPDLDVQAELDRYYTNYYGPAAGPMKRYHSALMNALESQSPSVFSGGRGMHLIFTPQLLEVLGACIAEAEQQVKGQEPYERRLKGPAAGHEYARRIGHVLHLKKVEGKPVAVGDKPEAYLRSDRATAAFDEAQKFILSFATGDAVFDFSPTPPDHGSLGYLRTDVLENACYPYLSERALLSKF
jgi:hypothetical protein